MFVVPEEMEEEGGTVVNVADFSWDVEFIDASPRGPAAVALPAAAAR
jgi:hypothetical protein